MKSNWNNSEAKKLKSGKKKRFYMSKEVAGV